MIIKKPSLKGFKKLPRAKRNKIMNEYNTAIYWQRKMIWLTQTKEQQQEAMLNFAKEYLRRLNKQYK